MTTLMIVRHAQSLANKEGIFIGHIDMDLSELGHEQAKLLSEYLVKKEYPIDVIYSSDLLRPFHTVEPYAKSVNKDVIKDKDLREIYAGKWEGERFDDLLETFPDSYGMWKSDIGKTVCDGGESVAQLYERINSEVDTIAKENDGKFVLIGTHATPLRCLMARAAGVGVDGMQGIKWCENAGINIFEYSDGVLRAKELYICEHLGSLRSGLPRSV
ncbi:MAG: histidine phosphatase family protein [Ruminococcaceae bacterium]|nr:histidine phosphatase family protein [Oscillospiraceae bacterium]